MKRILTIQDISCFGKCSITIALPVISSMGVETVILPTALFSTHTLFPDYRKVSLSEQMLPFARQWKDNKVAFDVIYTGYLGSIEEIDIALEVIDLLAGENTLIFTDLLFKSRVIILARGYYRPQYHRSLHADRNGLL